MYFIYNYRLISAIWHTAKIMEHLIHSQLVAYLDEHYFIIPDQFAFFTFGPRGRRVRSARRPRGQNVAEIALDRRFLGTIIAVFKNNTMEIIHAIRTLRIVCGFLDMGDGCYLIFNKNQLMFVVRKSDTAQIKKKVILFFS